MPLSVFRTKKIIAAGECIFGETGELFLCGTPVSPPVTFPADVTVTFTADDLAMVRSADLRVIISYSEVHTLILQQQTMTYKR